MNEFNFVQWLAIVGPIATLTSGMYYLLREDLKQVETHRKEDVTNMFNLWKENQERWVECSINIRECNLRIEQILSRMEKSGR